jgi:hypothetical protein
VDEREPQLVTLVGVPGIGKSRLVYELLEVVDHSHLLARGTVPPVRGGRRVLGIRRDEEDADWVERSLRPLVGLSSEGSHESRQEAFAAWRRLVEAMADRRQGLERRKARALLATSA